MLKWNAVFAMFWLSLCLSANAGVTINYEMTTKSSAPEQGKGPLSSKILSLYRITPSKARIDTRVASVMSPFMTSSDNPILAKMAAKMKAMSHGIVLTRLDEEAIYSRVAGHGFKKTTFQEAAERQDQMSASNPALLAHYQWRELPQHKTILGCTTVGYEVTSDKIQGTYWFCRAKTWGEAYQFYKKEAAIRMKYQKEKTGSTAAAAAAKIPAGALLEMDATMNIRGRQTATRMRATSIKKETYDDSLFEPAAGTGDEETSGSSPE